MTKIFSAPFLSSRSLFKIGGIIRHSKNVARNLPCQRNFLAQAASTCYHHSQISGFWDKPYLACAKQNDQIVLAGCWAHARRKIYEARDEAPGLAGWLLNQVRLLYRIEEELRKRHAGARLRAARRSSASGMILARIHKALCQKLPAYLPQSRMGLALGYALGHWGQLERFRDDGRLEIDNNFRLPDPGGK